MLPPHFLSQALWIINIFIMFSKFLETHPCMGRTVWETHMAQLFSLRGFWSGRAIFENCEAQSLQSMACHCYWHLLWSALRKQWFLQHNSSGAQIDPYEDSWSPVKSLSPAQGTELIFWVVLLLTAVIDSHRSYINSTWGNYTSTFAWISSFLPPGGCHKKLKIA